MELDRRPEVDGLHKAVTLESHDRSRLSSGCAWKERLYELSCTSRSKTCKGPA